MRIKDTLKLSVGAVVVCGVTIACSASRDPGPGTGGSSGGSSSGSGSSSGGGSSGGGSSCIPGQQSACGCPGGGTGAQVCDAQGTGLGACGGCPTSGSGSGGGSGGGTCTPLAKNVVCGAAGTGCGSRPNGCGGNVDCGGCSTGGNVCYQTVCCAPSNPSGVCTTGTCGTISDGCGGSHDCGFCPHGPCGGSSGPNGCQCNLAQTGVNPAVCPAATPNLWVCVDGVVPGSPCIFETGQTAGPDFCCP